ncbi:tungsten ABC transporter permease [candidate division MSBL1 archaeon SCGC-AAA259I14]|uniref:Tungsten ABC transporter permease n=1 Tax=candidate division MSBL1 archaeon SCGC-AAA259I14 TaxID=1698268 RepID=A0A133UTT8_9EURY|nr:tungsten ABC transporter permease [candidate division MSBL1 archaeon SCGC-AAA259I14]
MKSKNRKFLVLGIVVIVAAVAGGIWYYQTQYAQEQEMLTVSTTTSLYDTGLLENAVGPAFREDTGIQCRFIPKGTGAAIKDAKMGNSDVILVHAKSKEKAFMEEGYGVNRKVIAYNSFVIVGSPNDPAGIQGMGPAEALKKIYEEGNKGNAVWASRDDGSGTNTKEIGLWDAAGYSYEEDVKGNDWFRSTGQGMGATLKYSSNNDAYTLADMGTYLAYSSEGLIDLEVLVDEGKELTNVYGVIPVNPEEYDKNFEGAMEFTKWLTSSDAQELIGNYGVEEFGRQLFHPAVEVLESESGDVYSWIVEYGFINGTECPEEYRYQASEYNLDFYSD